MTNSWTDIKNTDLVVVMGGNAAEAHPCGFKWVTEAKHNRGPRLIVVDPRFTRSAAMADVYALIRQGTDIAFLLGVQNWTKHALINAVLQPEFFVEIGEELAAEKGIKPASWVRVWSKRGSVKARAVVTKRVQPLICGGRTVHIVGIPLHWGFTGVARNGFGPNSLTPYVGDANIETPEYKAFLVDIEPIGGPVA